MTNKTLIEHWAEAKQIFEKRRLRGKPLFPTGLTCIDSVTDGIQRGEIWIVAGRPGQGKTTLALQIAASIADDPKHHVLFLSLEMQGWELVSRLFCSMFNIKYFDLKIGRLSESYIQKEKMFREYLTKIDFEVFEEGFTIAEVGKIIKESYLKYKPDVVFLDFIQLIEWARFGSERIALAEYMRQVKKIAKELKVAFVVASQLRRLPAGVEEHEPGLSDLYGSGALEAAADKIIILYGTKNGDEEKHFIKMAKCRQGELFTKQIIFNGAYYRFDEIEDDKTVNKIKETFDGKLEDKI